MSVLSAEDHRSQLVQSGGLQLMVRFLTEDREEVRTAATFILHTCTQTGKTPGSTPLHDVHP